MTSKKPALKDVLATLAIHAPDMTIRKEDCGEYRVTFTQDAIARAYPEMTRAERIAKAESLAAYESDISDAYETAKAMYRVGIAPAPTPAPLSSKGLPANRESELRDAMALIRAGQATLNMADNVTPAMVACNARQAEFLGHMANKRYRGEA